MVFRIGRTEVLAVKLPSGHTMSSRRLFVSGLLSSRARLRFAGYRMLPHYFNRSKSASKPLVQAPSYWHNQRQPRAGFRTLETPDRCLKDRVHLNSPQAVETAQSKAAAARSFGQSGETKSLDEPFNILRSTEVGAVSVA